MSRTKRCKSTRSWFGAFTFQQASKHLPKNATEREIEAVHRALQRRDAKPGDRNAPSWFRRMINAENRAKSKMALINAVKEDAEDVNPPALKKSNWEWW